MLADALSVYGMQEVRGSNPRNSTFQLKAVNSNSRREAAFLFSRPRSGAAPRGGMENVQVRYEVKTLQGLADDFLQRMQAHFEVAIR
jgi:hypothetical protein